MNNLLILGTVAFDAIETPFGKVDKIIGGAASYIALAASQFDVNSGIISVVGGDFPQSFLNKLNDKRVDTSGIEVKADEETFFWSGRYHNDLNVRDTLVTDLNVLADFEPKIPEHLQEPDFLMLGNLHPEVQMAVIDQIPKRPKFVVLDTMNYWMENTWDELLAVLKKVDVITINDEEARQLSGEYSLVKAAKKIERMGPKYVVIKKGEHGALLFNEDKIFFAPALPLEEVFDPTGAGDTFAGGFIGHIAGTQDISFNNMKRAIIAGSNLASFCVEQFGTERMQELTKIDINNRLKLFKELTHFEIDLD
ncbi:MAG: sugar kinase [Flavobacteriales bacterium]|nr:MAG: sugar kinase [Flavobacteriales bacterium]